jgi:cell division septum initiation protein DivIVA
VVETRTDGRGRQLVYDAEQVHRYVAYVHEQLEQARREIAGLQSRLRNADAAASALESENEELLRLAAALEKRVVAPKTLTAHRGERSDEISAPAHQEAQRLIDDAREEAGRILDEAHRAAEQEVAATRASGSKAAAHRAEELNAELSASYQRILDVFQRTATAIAAKGGHAPADAILLEPAGSLVGADTSATPPAGSEHWGPPTGTPLTFDSEDEDDQDEFGATAEGGISGTVHQLRPGG